MLPWLILGAVVPSACVCWAAAWIVRRLGPRLGLVDRPGARKIHEKPMPTSGGLAIWLGLVVPLGVGQGLLWMLLAARRPGRRPRVATRLPEILVASGVAAHLPGLWQQSARLWLLLGGGTVLMVLGLADDRRGLDWRFRLAAQTAVAATMVACGWCVRLPWDVPGLAFAVSVVWIVGLVNSFNMLDNMDGLVGRRGGDRRGNAGGGRPLFASARQPSAATLRGRFPPPFRRLPAGISLAQSAARPAVHGRRRQLSDRLPAGHGDAHGHLCRRGDVSPSGFPGALAPLCVMAVPIYDTASVVLIRLRQGRSPFVGDKSHFSHRLVDLGMTKSQAVLTVYLATATCGLGALLLHEVDTIGAVLILLLVACTLLLVAVLESAGEKNEQEESENPKSEYRNPKPIQAHITEGQTILRVTLRIIAFADWFVASAFVPVASPPIGPACGC